MTRARALLVLLLAACALVAAAPPQPLLAVTVYEGGLARVDAFIPTNGSVSVAVPLLGRPDPSLGVLVVARALKALYDGLVIKSITWRLF
jgi:hypothetical protein